MIFIKSLIKSGATNVSTIHAADKIIIIADIASLVNLLIGNLLKEYINTLTIIIADIINISLINWACISIFGQIINIKSFTYQGDNLFIIILDSALLYDLVIEH